MPEVNGRVVLYEGGIYWFGGTLGRGDGREVGGE